MASKDRKQPNKKILSKEVLPKDDSLKSELLHQLKTRPFIFVGTIIVLVFITIAFVFVPAIVPRGGQSGEELIFGYYNKTPIKYVPNNFFARAQQVLTQEQNLSQDDPDFMEKYTNTWRAAFEESVMRIGILDEMKQSGFIVPEELVDRQMAELPHFQENGRFSSAKYRAMDNSTRQSLWQQVQENIIIDSYMSDLRNLKTAPAETSFISAMASPQRTFDMVVFSLTSYPDSDVIAFAEENPDLFRTIRLSRITITSSEREARQVLDSIKNGTTTFEEAARNNSQDWAADRGGDIGQIMAYELTYDLSSERDREIVLSLRNGEISDVITASWGWALYRADEASRPPDYDDEALKIKIRNYILVNLRGRIEDWLISEAERFIADVRQLGFDEAVAAWNITKKTFGPLSINFGDTAVFASVVSSGILELQNAGKNQTFWRTAFSTPVNSPSNPFAFENNVMILYPLNESPAEEDEVSFIASYFPYWMGLNMDNAYRSYFLTNEKMDNRFEQTFRKIWGE